MIRMMRLMALLCLLPAQLAAFEASQPIDAADGTYTGIASGSGRQFLGIRYAEAPVGDLRWRAPQQVAPAGEVKAQAFGARCVQPQDGWNFAPTASTPMTGSEDCLFLNVYGPAEGNDLPVMVWIPGGGFVTGAGSDYDAHILAETQDVIVVTLNYRLGALGFLAHPELGEGGGNFGLQDQQMALEWVARNIQAFGGDPARVTLFGESAGGVSICGHLRSPDAAGLFSAAIIQSGPCFGRPRDVAEQTGMAYAEAAGCEGENAMACLRALPATTAATIVPGDVAAGSTPWSIVNGTETLPRDLRAFADGDFNRVPVINGSNLDEGRLFAEVALPAMQSAQNYEANLRVQFGDAAEAVLDAYPVSSYPSIPLAYADYMTDFMFACPALSASKAMAAHTAVYAYEFSERSGAKGSDTALLPSLGAHHAKEIQFIFQTPTFFGGPAELSSDQMRLSQQMMAAWAAFARTGSPVIDGQPEWPAISDQRTLVRNIDLTAPALRTDFASVHNCAFWDAQLE
ncbi:carboxylesterase family protein [uncultured Paracoccus sp.]|uniref:carboxylesterase/lipase family protein n=1 Tax=uncultured Paracoccus sp. TaxID=189685 RepID=UPI002624AE57|nr:carboxylesterase family protein [uncultured Paracoccus sp.]